jgi:hypothetical protein
MLHDAMATFASVAGLGGLSTSSPFVFGGKTLMLTPSADPNSWLPTLASPIAGVGAKLLTAFGPFQELEQFLLGQRGTQPTTGLSQLGDELLRAALPAHVTRAMATMTKDDRNSMYASSVKSAIQIMAYNGELDVDKIRTEGDKTRILETASNTAIAVLGLRFILGISLPASPETMQNPGLTVEARQLGLKSLRRGYTELLTKFNGDSDKATLAWFKINPRLLPFTVSTTEAKKQTYPSLTVDAGKWIKQNMQFVKEYPEAMPFLAPRAGEFSFGTYSLAKSLGYIEGKSVDQSLLEIITSRDYYVYRNTKDSYEAALAGATSSQEKAAYDQQWDNLTRQMYAENPFLETRVNQFSDKSNVGLKKRVLVDMRSALQDIYKNRPNLVNESTDRIYSMVQTFDSAMADIAPYVGKTDTYSETVRRNYRDRLRGILVEIAGDDVNAKTFYDTTLDRLIGG